jgi:hypothetical protein
MPREQFWKRWCRETGRLRHILVKISRYDATLPNMMTPLCCYVQYIRFILSTEWVSPSDDSRDKKVRQWSVAERNPSEPKH